MFILDRKYDRNDPVLEKIAKVSVFRLTAPKINQAFEKNRLLFTYVYQVRNTLDIILFGLFSRFWYRENSNFDVIHVHDVFLGLTFLLFNRGAQKKTFYTQHGISFQHIHSSIKASLYHFARIFVLRHVIMTIALNPTARNQLVKESGLAQSKVVFLPSGVDNYSNEVLSSFSQNSTKYDTNGRTILFVGRITKQKGLRTLIYAVDILVKLGFSDLNLIIVGPTEQFDTQSESSVYSRQMLTLIDELSLGKNVQFVGPVSLEDLQFLFCSSEFLVLPSLSENFPVVVIEAMAHSKPVIASNLPGTSIQIVDGWNGFLVQAGDSTELANKMKYFLDNREKTKIMGINARLYVSERFNANDLAIRMVQIYQNARTDSD